METRVLKSKNLYIFLNKTYINKHQVSYYATHIIFNMSYDKMKVSICFGGLTTGYVNRKRI